MLWNCLWAKVILYHRVKISVDFYFLLTLNTEQFSRLKSETTRYRIMDRRETAIVKLGLMIIDKYLMACKLAQFH